MSEDDARALVAECEKYLKPGETPRQRMDRDFKEMQSIIRLWARDKADRDRLREALRELVSYAASVWVDEATAIQEERDAMHAARAALSPTPER